MLKQDKKEPIIEKDMTHKGAQKQGQQQAYSVFIIVIALILCLMGFKPERGCHLTSPTVLLCFHRKQDHKHAFVFMSLYSLAVSLCEG